MTESNLPRITILLLMLCFFSFQTFSQNLNIETKAIRDGYFQTLPSNNGRSICKYKKKKSIIITKVGNGDWWYGKSKNCEGWILGLTIEINDEMKEALKNYNLLLEKEERERERLKIIEEKEKEEKDRIKKLNKKRIADSVKLVKIERQAKALKKIAELDSIAKLELRNNCHYVRNEIDKYEKVKVVLTEYYGLKSDSASDYYLAIQLYMFAGIKYVYFSIDEDLGCASSYESSKSSVKVYLENNDMLTFYHIGDVDCADFTLFGRLTSKDIQRLKKSPIQSIRLTGTDYYKDIEDIEYKEFFLDKLKCLE